jgi:hypothetical protein
MQLVSDLRVLLVLLVLLGLLLIGFTALLGKLLIDLIRFAIRYFFKRPHPHCIF